MDMITTIRNGLQKVPLSAIGEISVATGVPATTIIKIKYGETDNPRIRTAEPLYRYFMREAA